VELPTETAVDSDAVDFMFEAAFSVLGGVGESKTKKFRNMILKI
jgi:hypothetical protein